MLTAVSMGFFVLSLYFGAFLKRATGETDINDKINRGFRMFCGISLGVGIVPVVFARIFLFVECFIVLRGVPRETYDTIVWAGALPGFG